MHKIPHGEGATPIRRATDEHHLEGLKEAGGEVLALSDTPGLHEGPECLGAVHTTIEAHEPGGVLLATSAIPAPTEETASIELVGTAERAAATEPEALEPWAGDKAGCGAHSAPRTSMARGWHAGKALRQDAPTPGVHRLDTAL
jgi:hypothetical protein